MRGSAPAFFRDGSAVYLLCMWIGLGVPAPPPDPSNTHETRTSAWLLLRVFSGRGNSETNGICSGDSAAAAKGQEHAQLERTSQGHPLSQKVFPWLLGGTSC